MKALGGGKQLKIGLKEAEKICGILRKAKNNIPKKEAKKEAKND